MKSIITWGLLAIVATAGAMIAKGNANSSTATSADQLEMSAAFRDGNYLGKLQAEHGNAPHIAVGRWATAENRLLFSSGYEKGYAEQMARKAPSRVSPYADGAALYGQSSVAGFRDGLYYGKLDSDQGRVFHLAVGRWSTPSGRAAFVAGYDQGYSQRLSAKSVTPVSRFIESQ